MSIGENNLNNNLKHNFLTMWTWHVCQTLQANLNQPDFQCLLMSIQRSTRTCEIRWKSMMVIFLRNRFQVYFPLFLYMKNLSRFAWLCMPASRSFAHQDVNSNSKFPSAVQLFLIVIAAVVPVPDSAAIRCIIPISHGHSVNLNLSNAWYWCIPPR